jgi:transcriptional regulator with XRE-family HTH domain
MQLNLKKIKELRTKRKISLEEMAHYLGYKTATGYFYAETGRCNFKPDHIPMIASKFDVPMESLFFENNIAKTANDEQAATSA